MQVSNVRRVPLQLSAIGLEGSKYRLTARVKIVDLTKSRYIRAQETSAQDIQKVIIPRLHTNYSDASNENMGYIEALKKNSEV